MEQTRRTILAATGSMAAASMSSRVFAGWEPAQRYPDPAVEILDPSFAKYRLALTSVERLRTGVHWAEGPVWFGDTRMLLISDVPSNRIMKWDEDTGQLASFANHRITPTGTHAIAWAGSSPANTRPGV